MNISKDDDKWDDDPSRAFQRSVCGLGCVVFVLCEICVCVLCVFVVCIVCVVCVGCVGCVVCVVYVWCIVCVHMRLLYHMRYQRIWE